jgi:hypothetical protein
MEPNEKNLYSVRYTIPKEAIPDFVEGLRKIQEDMIEAVVASKATQGYPEANQIIKHIMEL